MLKGRVKKSTVAASVLILAVAAGVVFAAITLNRIYGRYTREANLRTLAETKLSEQVNKIQKVLSSIEEIPENLSYVLEFSHPQKEQMYVLLNSIIGSNDVVFGACIAFEPRTYHKDTLMYAPYLYKKNGQILTVDPADTADHYFSMDWYLIPKMLQKPVWIEPYFEEGLSGGNTIVSTYSVPFYYYDGTKEIFYGIVTIDIALEWLADVVASFSVIEGSYAVLVSENGTVITAPIAQWPYNETIYTLAEELNVPALREIGRELQNGKSGSRHVGRLGAGREWRVYYRPIPANKWGVLLLVPEESTF